MTVVDVTVRMDPVVFHFEFESPGTSTSTVLPEDRPWTAEKVILATPLDCLSQVAARTCAPFVMAVMLTEREFESVTPMAELLLTDSVPATPSPVALLSDTARVSESALIDLVTSALSGVTARESRLSAVASMSVLAMLKGVADRLLGVPEYESLQVAKLPCVQVYSGRVGVPLMPLAK